MFASAQSRAAGAPGGSWSWLLWPFVSGAAAAQAVSPLYDARASLRVPLALFVGLEVSGAGGARVGVCAMPLRLCFSRSQDSFIDLPRLLNLLPAASAPVPASAGFAARRASRFAHLAGCGSSGALAGGGVDAAAATADASKSGGDIFCAGLLSSSAGGSSSPVASSPESTSAAAEGVRAQPVPRLVWLEPEFEHLDFIWGAAAPGRVFPAVVAALDEFRHLQPLPSDAYATAPASDTTADSTPRVSSLSRRAALSRGKGGAPDASSASAEAEQLSPMHTEARRGGGLAAGATAFGAGCASGSPPGTPPVAADFSSVSFVSPPPPPPPPPAAAAAAAFLHLASPPAPPPPPVAADSDVWRRRSVRETAEAFGGSGALRTAASRDRSAGAFVLAPPAPSLSSSPIARVSPPSPATAHALLRSFGSGPESPQPPSPGLPPAGPADTPPRLPASPPSLDVAAGGAGAPPRLPPDWPALPRSPDPLPAARPAPPPLPMSPHAPAVSSPLRPRRPSLPALPSSPAWQQQHCLVPAELRPPNSSPSVPLEVAAWEGLLAQHSAAAAAAAGETPGRQAAARALGRRHSLA